MTTPVIPTQPPGPLILKDSPIRRFADSGIQASIDRAVSELPPGKAGAVVVYANMEQAGMAIVGKLGARWTVVFAADRPWDGERGLEAEAQVRYSWPD
jgi:hypothetical protein